ncbi:Na+/H+ antiporter subunit A [Nesterenkonia aerolata]|uniref:Na+/H+ antiporter subunit A n=1 Tax=Nesterenkonia aerolata TaxID=3074079 RepID=A0ABU2DRB2_9MICC|nr:Na+/H+ antiporter subunit A [Nesterenkonia sp. LY-0111]MDR8019037.1 Na+/H+ antiporter subunit A [Nesterenkonia sp. LY-0111]
MLTVLAVLFAVSIAVPWVYHRLGRPTFFLLAGVNLAAMIYVALAFAAPALQADQAAGIGQPNAPPGAFHEWLPEFGVSLAFRLDALSLVMAMLILGVGALVMLYCARYFKASERAAGPFAAQLFAFGAAMFGIVISDDVVMLFIFWEITTVLSFLLIGYSAHRIFARRSAIQALIVTKLGGLTMLVGLLWIGDLAGSNQLSEIMAAAPGLSGTQVDIAIVLVLVGALAKSAIVPFHFWLPAAMAAPTPVSAYLHAAAMVKAGVYLVARFAPGFHDTSFWLPVILGFGLTTMLVGAYRALRQTDIKLVLAYGTVSQLGFLVMINGLGTENAALAGVAMILAHGLFKAALFMVVGIIDHESGTRDLRVLSGLRRTQRPLFWISVVSAASMAGLPPLFGFVAKEVVLESFLEAAEVRGGWFWVVVVGVVVASALTVAYSARFLWGAFGTKRDESGAVLKDTRFHEPVDPVFLAAPAVLTAGTVLFAVWPAPLEAMISPYTELFGPVESGASMTYLALWHGFTLVLALSALTWVLGALLFLGRAGVARLQERVPAVFDAERTYRASIRSLDAFAQALTSRTQSGSLGHYLFIILAVATVLPVVAVLYSAGGLPTPDSWIIAEEPLQVVLGVVVIAGAFGAVLAPKRFMAVLMVGLCGYGIAGLLGLQGAPDLALTVLLVESIVLVVFVLALRTLPAGIWTRSLTRSKVSRAVLAIGFALVMMGLAALAVSSRSEAPISEEFPWMSLDVGHGANIVNVTLVDIRVWDTFGEITVIAAAATGVASLIFVKRRDVRRLTVQDIPTGSVGRVLTDENFSPSQVREIRAARSFATVAREAWLVAGRTLAPEHRSIIFEVVTRLLFHAIVLLSVYLLLAGHNTPGGGFAGGLMAGLAFVLRYLAGGRYELEAAMRFSAGGLMGSGIVVACVCGIAPLFVGGQVFQSFYVDLDLPLFGEQALVSSVLFDVGVYLVVIGLIVDVLRSLGSEIDLRSEEENRDTSDYGHGVHAETSMGVAR